MTIRSIKSDAEHIPCVIILDHHPADSRTDIAEDQETIQTLTSRMGTGGGNVPMILVNRNEQHKSVVINSSGDDVYGTIDSNYYKGSGSERERVWTIGNGQTAQLKLQQKAGTLNCMHDQQILLITLYED